MKKMYVLFLMAGMTAGTCGLTDMAHAAVNDGRVLTAVSAVTAVSSENERVSSLVGLDSLAEVEKADRHKEMIEAAAAEHETQIADEEQKIEVKEEEIISNNKAEAKTEKEKKQIEKEVARIRKKKAEEKRRREEQERLQRMLQEAIEEAQRQAELAQTEGITDATEPKGLDISGAGESNQNSTGINGEGRSYAPEQKVPNPAYVEGMVDGHHVRELPVNAGEWKSYMGYTTIRSVTSAQYQLQQLASTAENGIRVLDGRYMVAVGSYFTTKMGVKLDVHLEDGTTIPCITGDAKQDIHTIDEQHMIALDGSVIEFIVDVNALDPYVRRSGTIGTMPGFGGKIVSVTLYLD